MFGKQPIHLTKAVEALKNKKDHFNIKTHYIHEHNSDTHLLSVQPTSPSGKLITFNHNVPVLNDHTELALSNYQITNNLLIKNLYDIDQNFRLYIMQIDKGKLAFKLTSLDLLTAKTSACVTLADIVCAYLYDTLHVDLGLSKAQLRHYLEPIFNQRFQYQALKNELYDINEAAVPVGEIDPKIDTSLFNAGFNYRQYNYQKQEEVSELTTKQLSNHLVKVWDDYRNFITGLLTDLNYDFFVPLTSAVNAGQIELFKHYLFDLYEKVLTKQNYLSISALQKGSLPS